MKISFYTNIANRDLTRGYGNAGYGVITSLQKLGHEVPFDDSSAPVQICFCPPTDYKFHDNQYKIGYTPWESSELPHGWLEAMNDCDEVWATSAFVAEVYKNAGVTKPIYVYHHGIDPAWEPRRRQAKNTIKFLHVGEPALRKGGQMTLDAFRSVFGDREDVHLTFKTYHQHYLRTWYNGKVVDPDLVFDNVSIIKDNVPKEELMDIYYDHDILVYPSYGEGFGLIPLQALASGMPVITTRGWAPYEDYILLPVNVSTNRSIWSLHPGDVFYPDYDDLKHAITFFSEHADVFQAGAFKYSQDIHEEYNWLKLTEKAFDHIVKKFT